MFPYDLDSGIYCLSDTPEKTESDICSTFRNIRKNNSSKIVIDQNRYYGLYQEEIRSFSWYY